jgi:beta-lactamase superfamily II metal-dependent hydrolase
VKPQFIVISAGEDNRYGPSRREVLQRVIDVAAAVLRADVLGTIKLATDGHWNGRGSRSSSGQLPSGGGRDHRAVNDDR